MFKKNNFIIFLIVINIIISVCMSMNALAAGNLAIYTMPVITFDQNRNLWVYAGTGKKTDPQANSGTERIYGIKDSDRTHTYILTELEDVASNTTTDGCTKNSWYFNLRTNEKMLADPDVFQKKLYFTTYIPASLTDTCCTSGGSSYMYVVDYECGTAEFASGQRSELISTDENSGIPSSPIISRNPVTGTYDVYVSTSVTGSMDIPHTAKVPDDSPPDFKPRTLIYWKDMRIE